MTLGKKNIILRNWPFKKGEKARLLWIGEPYKKDNKWMVNTYFRGDYERRRIIVDWGNIHFLSIDKVYIDGNLNKGQTTSDKELMTIDLSNAKVYYNERDWVNSGKGFYDKTKSKTFNFQINNIMYTIPIVEFIRAILAPDRFMLNRILEMNSFENYFTYELKNRDLNIHFTSEYDAKLLDKEKIWHIAWIISNPNIFKMFNEVGQNLWFLKELKFEYLFKNFKIKARIDRQSKSIRILEIVSLMKKKINVREINVYHPSLEKTETSSEVKKRKYISRTIGDDRELTSDGDGATKATEEIDTILITHEYESITCINKVRTGRRINRSKENEDTEKYITEDTGLRTTADEGGLELIKGLEFKTLATIEEKGELKDFLEVLKLLAKRSKIEGIEIIIDELPEGIKGKRFSKLRDGITKRKYAIGKLKLIDGRECSLIEIEREDRALSMLLIKANNKVNWEWIYSLILLGLVDGSGKWSNLSIERIEKKGMTVVRNKHIKRTSFDDMELIYKKLF